MKIVRRIKMSSELAEELGRRSSAGPNSFVTFVNFCSKIFVFPDSCLCSGLMGLEEATESCNVETERKRWLGRNLALPKTKRERVKLAKLANFEPAKTL